MKHLSIRFDSAFVANSKYYKCGFDGKMNRREAALILDKILWVSKYEVKDAFKVIAVNYYPDRGGSIFVASKINVAKYFLEKHSE